MNSEVSPQLGFRVSLMIGVLCSAEIFFLCSLYRHTTQNGSDLPVKLRSKLTAALSKWVQVPFLSAAGKSSPARTCKWKCKTTG